MRVIPEATVQIVQADGRTAARGAMGEMLISSPTTTPGYWNGPGDCIRLPDGMFHSGDLVREREPGLLEYLGRAKDIIVRAGANISPSEVEEALRSHPGVVDAGVAGLPDPALGQRVGALVVLAAGPSRPSIRDVRSWLSDQLAPWKLPEHIRAVQAIPRNALTKIDRAAVRREITRHADPPDDARP
jgi:acyl-CoA synthetase (AMP-forming)/AMP-acid ligase II